MTRVVLDTNVLVSSLIKRGRARELLDRIIENRLSLVLSEEILSEFVEVMAREKFQRYVTKSEVERFVSFLLHMAEIVEVKSKFKVVEEDPKDDAVLNTAYDCRAKYIITGDEHLLKIRRYRGIRIFNVAEILEKL